MINIRCTEYLSIQIILTFRLYYHLCTPQTGHIISIHFITSVLDFHSKDLQLNELYFYCETLSE